MAKVKIQGHASGTGILTVTAPNTSTDRTITLPDATGTLLNSDGDGSSLTGVGGDLSFGGDTFGADKTIGSNDTYSLSFETDGTERLQLHSDGRGLSQFTAKAWCNFDGTGTVALRDSHNVSSLVDHETGRWNVNFTNTLGNANYSISGQSGDFDGASRAESDAICTFHEPTTSTVGIQALYLHSDSREDSDYVSCMVFGD